MGVGAYYKGGLRHQEKILRFNCFSRHQEVSNLRAEPHNRLH